MHGVFISITYRLMKRVVCIVALMLLAFSCRKEQAPVCEVLNVEHPCTVTRVSLSDNVNAVWNAGDKLSVFYNGGINEQWEYTGSDGAFKGTISHEGNSDRVGLGRFVAVWPYDAGNGINGDVVSTVMPAVQEYKPSSFGWALLVSKTEDSSLRFEYATGFVRVSLSGIGKVRSVSVRGNDREILAGHASIDVSGSRPQASISSSTGAKTLTVKDGYNVLETLSDEATDFWIAMIPGTFHAGLTVLVALDDGSTKELGISGPVTINAGEVVCVYGRIFGYETITADFTVGNAFSPALPGSVVTTEGTHTFSSGDRRYSFTFHPVVYSSGIWGYGTYEGSLLIGRNDSWIKLPVLSGCALYEVEYLSADASGGPFLSDTTVSPSSRKLSNQIDDASPDNWFSVTVRQLEKEKQYYLVVGKGNLRIKQIILKYVHMD